MSKNLRRNLSFLLLPAAFACSSDPDDPNPPVVVDCPTPTGTGTDHPYAIEDTQTWEADGSPHRVASGMSVRGTLIIAPCATVLVAGAIGVRGTMIAEGTAAKPITISALDPTEGWPGILVENNAGNLRLAHTTIRGAGDPNEVNVLAAIDVRGPSLGPVEPRIHVDHVTIDGSGAYGVVLRDYATFTPDSTDLKISGAAYYPIMADAGSAGSIPSGTYTGNTTDELLLDVSFPVGNDITLKNHGVPYRLGDGNNAGTELTIGIAGPVPQDSTLTIEAGVVIRATQRASIFMHKASDNSRAVGKMIARGTAAQPILFTSAAEAPAAGDWLGIIFNMPDATNVIDYARVEYAGGRSGANSFHCEADGGFSEDEDAGITQFGEPSGQFITNTAIVNSAGDGINRAWNGSPIDFLPTNTFEGIAECQQTFPRAMDGACPATTECL